MKRVDIMLNVPMQKKIVSTEGEKKLLDPNSMPGTMLGAM